MTKREADGSVVKKENLAWTDKMDNVLIEALVNEHKIGNQVNAIFTSQTNANMITTNPDATAFKAKKISNYDHLDILFLVDRASGSKAETTKEKNDKLNKSTKIKIEKVVDVNELMANNEVILDNEYKDDDGDIQIVSATHVTPDESSKAKKLENEDEVVAEPVPQPQPESFELSIVHTFKEIIDITREGNKYHVYTGEEIEKELEPMGLDDNEFVDAFIYLLPDTMTIFSSSMKMRKIFVRKMINGGKKLVISSNFMVFRFFMVFCFGLHS
uniref:Uncharacterized protein n=1 Tax=Lactuca sativa TaxID=4236 RepID=A0A9R1USC1_LACSA|nr:hypothetical protein LSAT_V11C800427430 [Lactuca sativa]